MECPHCHSQISTQSKHCKRCGGAIPAAQYLLEELGLNEEQETAETTASPARSSSRKASAYRFARLGDRFIAFALDLALLFGLFAIVDAWAFMRWGIFDGSELQLTTATLLIAITLNAAILFLYGWLLEAAFGATLGKILVGIRIVRTAQCGALSSCAVRNLLRIVDGLGFYLVGTAVAACSEVRQRIGDICAHTAVIEEKFGMFARIAAVVLWMATLVGAGYMVPRICANNQSIRTKHLSQVIVRIGRNGNTAYFRVAGITLDVKS
jgi:uncharacterized RDD family membrane protein YckC